LKLQFILGSLDENQNFLFIPLLHTSRETMNDLEDMMPEKSVMIIFETLSIFPGKINYILLQNIIYVDLLFRVSGYCMLRGLDKRCESM